MELMELHSTSRCADGSYHKAWAKVHMPRQRHTRKRPATAPVAGERTGTRSSKMRGSTRSNVNDDAEDIIGLKPEHQGQRTKELLNKVCDLLNVDSTMLMLLPQSGFAKAQLQTERSVQAANLIANKLMEKILYLISPENEDFYTNWKESVKCTSEQSRIGVDSNLANLIFCGNRNSRIIAESILCSSYNNAQCNEILLKEYVKHVHTADAAKKQKLTFLGKVKISTARRIFKDQLLKGDGVKKHGYAFRVPAGKLIKVIDYLKGNLLVKPGVMRDVRIAGYKFKNLSVYQRGGHANQRFTSSISGMYEYGRQSRIRYLLSNHKAFNEIGERQSLVCLRTISNSDIVDQHSKP